MSNSVRPQRRQPTRLPRPWDSPGKNAGVGCHFLLQCMRVKSESEVTQPCPTLSEPMDCGLPGSSIYGVWVKSEVTLILNTFCFCSYFVTPWTVAYQVPLSMGFSRQEDWSGLPFPSSMHKSEKWKWSHSAMSDSLWPHGLQPTRLLRPWDFPGKNTGMGCHFLLQCMKVKSESEVTQPCPTSSNPMDFSLPGSSVLGFSRQEYWSGLPLPSPLDHL